MVLRMFQYEIRDYAESIYLLKGILSLVDSHRVKTSQRLSMVQSRTLEASERKNQQGDLVLRQRPGKPLEIG